MAVLPTPPPAALVATVLLVALTCPCSGLPLSRPSGLQQLVNANTDFGFDLYHKIRELQNSDNIFFSPWSISQALAMTYAGASGNTMTQMAEVLKFKNIGNVHGKFRDLTDSIFNQPAGTYTLKQANKLYGEIGYSFEDTFVSTLLRQYESPLERMDFLYRPERSRLDINSWVEQQTEDKIKDLLPPTSVTSATVLVLINALYFKANWKTSFHPRDTTTSTFYLRKVTGGEDEHTTVHMMTRHQANVMYTHNKIAKYQMVELPYSDRRMSMYIVLPDDRFGIHDVAEHLTADNLSRDIQHLEEEEVNIQLPKFKIRTKFELKRMLVQMGMRDAFSGLADFRNMTDRPVWLDEVYHQAFVDVNEKGTEAAAATGVVVVRESASNPSLKQFKVDHPFLLFIRERQTGSILFMGKIGDPKAAA